MPEDVQNAIYRSIKGFENIEIMRPAYAIEYDCVDPTSLEATLESKVVRGLYGAGQFNGPRATRKPPRRACWPV